MDNNFSSIDLSIVIPVYNEQDGIKAIYNSITHALSFSHLSYEIIFIDDGSQDQSLAEIKQVQCEDACVKVVCFDRNQGKTSALNAGFKLAAGEYVATIDADLQYDPKDIVRMLDVLKQSRVDAVFGKRANRNSGLFKIFCSKSAGLIRTFVLKESYQDASFALIKTEAIKSLPLYNQMEVFIPTLLTMQGYRIKELDVVEYPRKSGYSKYNFRNRILKLLWAMLVVKWLKDNQLKCKDSVVYPSNECSSFCEK